METGLDNKGSSAASPPPSAVSIATGLVGLAGLALATALLAGSGIGPIQRSLLLMAATALPMILWAVLVEKVHLGPDTGLDYAKPRPLAETIETTKVKLLGLWVTWFCIFLLYFAVRHYHGKEFVVYYLLLAVSFGPLFLLSVPYVFLVDRYMTEPHDGLWHMGKWVSGDWRSVDSEKLKDHARSWLIKAFFLAFMLSIFPSMVLKAMNEPLELSLANPVAIVGPAIVALFIIDTCFGTVGYILTFRPLASHIRSANPYLSGWVSALLCYPPFAIMTVTSALDYRQGGLLWSEWFAGNTPMLFLWGAVLVVLTAVYAWSTVIFGVRFSNLTHRGIITNGPYRWCKHPAYLSKNLFWWMATLPFLSMDGGVEALRNCILLLAVNAIYFARARTEERHLMEDADYRLYAAWIAEHGMLPRLWRRLRRPAPARQPKRA